MSAGQYAPPWADEDKEWLRQLWMYRDEHGRALSTRQIGETMGRSKNSVVGVAHRLDLPPRQSPIKRREGAPAPRKPARAGADTLPALASVSIVPAVVPTRAPGSAAMRPQIVAPPQDSHVAARSLLRAVSKRDCCWPIGDPGTKGFRFCDAPAHPGKPYCAEHCALAYARPGQRENAEAAA